MKVFFLVGSFSVIEPMGALQLSAVLRAAGHSCAIGALDEDGLIQRLQDQKADAVALSFMTTEAADFLKFLRILKERLPSIIVIAGGPHPTYFPGIAKTWPLDAIVQGEGEVAIVPLLEALVAGGPICDISGVHTREFKNAPAALVKDLDIFPFADRDLIKDIEPLGTVRMKTFFATRGCPFACAYCFNSAFEDLYNVRGGGSLRRRSVENLIQEIEQVKAKFPVDFIRFGDDAIILKHDAWVDEFCEKYKKRIGLPFYFLINPICVNEKLVKALRLAGCHSVMMGIESGNEKVRESILGRRVSNEQVKEAHDLFRTNGIKVFANTILAIPETTIEDDLQSLEFTLECQPYYSGFTVFTPFPGTKLGEYAIRKGYVQDSSRMEDEFPKSMQSDSCLKHVTPKDKRIHHNIITLGPVANRLPFLRWLITRHFIYWPPNTIFDGIGFLVRNYCNMRIWPFRKSFKSFWMLFLKVCRIDKKNYD